MGRTLCLGALAGLWALSGCAQIFGLDETSSNGVDGVVSLTLTRASVGASVIKNPLDAQPVDFLVDDGAGGFGSRIATASGPGVYSAPGVLGAPPVAFTLPDNKGTHIWALGARAQRGNYVVFEHPGSQPPLPASEVAISASLPTPFAAGEGFRVEVIGAWMQATPALAPMVGATSFIDSILYSAFTPMLGNAPARFTSADVLLLLRYAAIPGGTHLTGFLQAQLDQTDGIDSLNGPMTPVATTSSMLSATIDPAALMTRYADVRPMVTGTVAQNYFVRAAPGISVGMPNGTLLVSGTPAMADTAIAAGFGNPFGSLGWKSVVEYATSMSRTYMLDTTHSVVLGATLSTVAEVTSQPLTLNAPVGLPTTIRINETSLTSDGTSVMLDLSKPITVDATIDQVTNTLYSARLVELDASGTAVVKKQIADVLTVGMPQFRFPAVHFTVGHTYYVQVSCYEGGFTGAADGDLQTAALPMSIGTLDSGVFTVTQ